MTLLDTPESPASSGGGLLGLDQWELFKQVKFRPHAGQIPILADDHRFQVASCGRRFGKSEVGGHRLLPEAMITYSMQQQLEDIRKRREFWIAGPNYSDAEKEFRVIYNQLKKLDVPFDKPGTYNDPIGGNMHISLWNGTFQVHAKSASHPESLVGEGLHGIIVAEAAKVKEKVWVKYLRPTLNDFKGWAMMTSTPEGKNWFYDMWQRGQDPKSKAWTSWRKPSWSNPYVYPLGAKREGLVRIREMLDLREMVDDDIAIELGVDPEVAQLMQDLTQPAFNQEIGADFTEFVGRVFSEFDEEYHVADLKYDPTWQTYAAVDYGYTNPNVWLLIQIDPFGEYINVLGEVYERGLGPDEFADEILRRNLAPGSLKSFYPDPASPGDSNVLARKLKATPQAGTGGEIKYRIDAIRAALKDLPGRSQDGRPRLQFDRSCTNSIQDFLAYRYADTKTEQDRNAPENPMKKDDHAPEALGRFFAGHFGTIEQRQGRARSRQATIRR